jgi:hypothetical protein
LCDLAGELKGGGRFPAYTCRRFLLTHPLVTVRLVRYRAVDRATQPAMFARLNCVFIHVPKAGGTSVNHALFGGIGQGHPSAPFYRRLLGKALFEEFFKFTFVRNPFERLVSAYEYLKRGGKSAGDREFSERVLSRYKSFDTFVQEWLTPETAMRLNHFRPQSSFLTDREGELLVDFVGRLEQMERDFARVVRTLGVEVELPRLNRTDGGRDYRRRYRDRTREIAASVYAEDLQRFGYVFDKTGCEFLPTT